MVEACIEDSLMYLNKNNSLRTTVTLPQGSCSVTINSQVGNVWDFTVAGSFEGYSKSVRVNATKGSGVTVNSWVNI